MAAAIGAALLAIYAAAFYPLLRLLRSPARPRWLQAELTVEYIMLAHIAALLGGAALLVDSLLA